MTEQLQLNLANAINHSYAESVRVAKDAETQMNKAVALVVECGNLLLQQKESLKHGGWLDWLEQNCPEVNKRTASRYMALAKKTQCVLFENKTHSVSDLENTSNVSNENTTHGVSLLKDASSIRQAYIATGILPEPPKRELVKEETPETPTVTFIRPLDRFRCWYNRRTEELPLKQWTPQMKRIMRNELRWFALRYFETGGSLDDLKRNVTIHETESASITA